MKVAVSAASPELSAQVDPRFGRAAAFVIVDPETMKWKAIGNENAAAGSGAGIQTAQMIHREGVSVVLTGSCGPNAYQTLSAAGVEIVTGVTGRVDEAVAAYRERRVRPAVRPNAPAHSGIGGGLGTGRGVGLGRGVGGRRAAPPSGVSPEGLAGLAEQLSVLARKLDSLQERLDAMEREER